MQVNESSYLKQMTLDTLMFHPNFKYHLYFSKMYSRFSGMMVKCDGKLVMVEVWLVIECPILFILYGQAHKEKFMICLSQRQKTNHHTRTCDHDRTRSVPGLFCTFFLHSKLFFFLVQYRYSTVCMIVGNIDILEHFV